MNIERNVSLKQYSSMRLGGNTKFLIDISSKASLVEAIKWTKDQQLSYLVIGGGNNIIWRDEGFDGVLLVNKIKGIESSDLSANKLKISLGAGEDWDMVVEKFTNLGYGGIECLSLIPGTCGAAPIQNIGAYGGDISNVLDELEAYDTQTDRFIVLSKNECDLGYRSSIFKYKDRNRYIITSITITLEKKNPTPPYYKTVEDYFALNNIENITPIIFRNAVIAIRQARLPDPKVNPNTGSFFTNPIINETEFNVIHHQFPDISFWLEANGKVKISASWLIDHIGYKDKFDPITGMSTWSQHSLTLVNRSAKLTADLLEFKQQIVSNVKSEFGIDLEQEPELLPAKP